MSAAQEDAMRFCDCGRPASVGAQCRRCCEATDRHDVVFVAGVLIWVLLFAAIAACGVQ